MDETERTTTDESAEPTPGETKPTVAEDVPAADGHDTSERGEIPADAEKIES